MQPETLTRQLPTPAQQAPPVMDYTKAPAVVFWEITKACALACRHCRANAQPKRHPQELTTPECMAVVDEIARFQPRPILVISGGDPLMRRDLFEVAAYGVNRGLHVSLSPSVTALVTAQNLRRAYLAGVRHISFSLDGATAEVHDGFRGVPGSFSRTLWAIEAAQQAGLTVQVNTVVSRWNLHQMEALSKVLEQTGIVLWDVFFLVPTGRAGQQEMVSAEEHEQVYHWLYGLSKVTPFRVKTTLGQPFRRITMQEAEGEGRRLDTIPSANDGKGVCFVSHLGMIYPSGFLPLPCGNVRTHSLVTVYRTHPTFLSLREPAQLKGKCGACPFNTACGGCRARAYACTGDYQEADPSCMYQPESYSASRQKAS